METIDLQTKEEKALEFAVRAHGEQKRKYTNDPYIKHPIEVAELVKSRGVHTDIVCAALLHDVVEDTPVAINEINQEFGIIIGRIVEDLTDVYTSEAFPNIRRKERKLLECYRLSKVSGNAKTIKLADLINNTSSIVENDPGFAKVYLEEKTEMLTALTGGDQVLMNLAVKTLKEAKQKLNL
jgi:(p)ppGpp synthase/HD superfamily hydrolase